MINLLPSKVRQDMLYARRNSYLLKWLFALIGTLVLTVFIILAGLVYLQTTTKSTQKTADTNNHNLQSQKLEETQKQVDEVSNNLKLATQVLSREILFSKLLSQLGSTLPANTALQELQIDKLQGGISLVALAKDINSSTQIQVNLQDPANKIFDKVDIETINCDSSPTSGKLYPCSVQLRALFAKNNPYLYITPTATTGVKP